MNKRSLGNRRAVLVISTLLLAWGATAVHAATPVDYDRDVLPIISEKCFSCHGPDEAARKKNLRFDTREGLLQGHTDSGPLITPGSPDASLLFQRITHADASKRMPPSDSHLELSADNIEVIRQWILEGAPWEGHWAFTPPINPPIPDVSDPNWCRNEIDYFILNRLDTAGLLPGPEASKEVLLRRVALDLTGLPPSIDDLKAFLADDSEDAYERAVDRLLASPHYGERMAFLWLDAARYSDSNGYQRDTKRIMWPWRDWVIQAFNANMPFDQFTVEQLAGDLLPDATLSQKIATGFNRNHRINGEGGIIPEEYAVEYVVDRVSTTSTTWMGLTMGCARCHDHKFDPFTQREFYELYAFFNQVPEQGKGGERGNDVPFIQVPTAEQSARRALLAKEIATKNGALNGPDERLDAAQASWENSLLETFAEQAWLPLGPTTTTTQNGAVLHEEGDGLFSVDGPNPPREVYALRFAATGPIGAFKLDALLDAALPETGPGRAPNGNVVVSDFEVTRLPAGEATPVNLPLAIALADFSQENEDYRVRNAIDGTVDTGWATGSHVRRENRTAIFVLEDPNAIQVGDTVTVRIRHESIYSQHALGRFQLRQSPSSAIARWAYPDFGVWNYAGPFPLESKNNQDLLAKALPPESGVDLAAVYADNLQWVAHPEWNDGEATRLDGEGQLAHYLYRTIHVAAPTTIAVALGTNDAVKLWVDGALRHENNVGRVVKADEDRVEFFLESGDHELLMKVVNFGGESGFQFRVVDDEGRRLLTLMAELSTPPSDRTEENQKKLREGFRSRDAQWVADRDALAQLRDEADVLERSIVTTMVMEDMATPRETHLLMRGAYDAPDTATTLEASVPAQLGEMDPDLPQNRLGLARWLLKPDHPLTSRVRVNLYWQQFFGTGIVKTSEDLGTQGTSPSHPELLDWLATTFVADDWNVKAMQKRIVMSATYRQNSVLTAEHRAKDPENILLGRAPRLRLPAEQLRDQALAVSGLLNEKIGGESVFPYQPEDMWSSLTFQNMDEYATNFYTPDTGDKLFRRGLYTFWKRTIAPPRMQIFDAADRERCSVRKETTNTPMQALVLLNDPTFVEAARHLAQRMIDEGGARSADRIAYGYRLALSHDPTPTRQNILLGGLSDYQLHFSQKPEDASAFLAVGDTEHPENIPDAELAAYTAVASVMLNLDEMITRE